MFEAYEKFGDYTVYLVNEENIRDMSEKLEEFSNYGIHSDFPKYIPQNEIWLSDHISDDEKFILISEALNRLKYELSGMSETHAYELALKHDKAMRHKFIHSQHIKMPTSNKPDDAIYLSHFGTFKDVEIYIVDGNLIRDFYKTDFVEGGHDYVYHFIPYGEVWIDIEVPRKERILIVMHEVTERALMKDKHLSYDKAHQKASKFEWRLRSQLK